MANFFNPILSFESGKSFLDVLWHFLIYLTSIKYWSVTMNYKSKLTCKSVEFIVHFYLIHSYARSARPYYNCTLRGGKTYYKATYS